MRSEGDRSEETYAATPGDVPRGTLTELFLDACDRLPEAPAFRRVVAGEWRSIGHRELEATVRELAVALRELGIEAGDRVAILSENRPEWAFADFATLCLGAVDVPIYTTLPAGQIEYLLRDSGAKLIFVSDAEQRDKVLEVAPGLPDLRKVVVFDELPGGDDSVITLSEALATGRSALEAGRGGDFRERARAVSPDDLATVLYTSGTTGRPKGVMLTHDNIFSNVVASLTALPVGDDDVALSLLPLSHIFERMLDYALFRQGVEIAYAESMEAVPRNLVEVRPTVVASVPRLYEKIYARVMSAGGVRALLIRWATGVGRRWADARLAGREPDARTRVQHAIADRLVFSKLRARTGGRLKFFVSGGAPLNPDIGRFFYSAKVLILEGYGLTETSPVIAVNLPDSVRFGTVGRPVPGTEVKIAGDGEILVRGRQVMKGYFNMPEATAEAIDDDGWFHTGDVGRLDQDGFLSITDRKKDLIVTAGGKNIAPAPIEDRVKMNRLVAEAVMIGDRRPYAVLLVVPDFAVLSEWARSAGIADGSPESLIRDERVQARFAEEVLSVGEELARFESPKKIALLSREFSVDGGELTPTMKVKRRVVEERFAPTIDALYETDAEVIAQREGEGG